MAKHYPFRPLRPQWDLQQYAQHYAETLAKPANAWGQHLSSIFGQSHWVMNEAKTRWDSEQVDEAFSHAIKAKACL